MAEDTNMDTPGDDESSGDARVGRREGEMAMGPPGGEFGADDARETGPSLFVRVARTAYPFASGRLDGAHGEEIVVEVCYEPGYAVDLCCTVNVDRRIHDAEETAIAIARALSGAGGGDIRVDRRYFAREHRNAVYEATVTEVAAHQGLSPRRELDRTAYERLIWAR